MVPEVLPENNVVGRHGSHMQELGNGEDVVLIVNGNKQEEKDSSDQNGHSVESPLQSPNHYPPVENNLLVSSPYTESDHLLDLRTLDTPCGLFARALAILHPIRSDYAIADYTDSFNWESVMTRLRTLVANEDCRWQRQSFYTVTFRSKLKPDINRTSLRQFDKESHREAIASGGLLKYWFGSPDGERRNLATCLWRNREDARLGGLGPWHKKARLAAGGLYERIDFTTWQLIIEDGVSGWKLQKS